MKFFSFCERERKRGVERGEKGRVGYREIGGWRGEERREASKYPVTLLSIGNAWWQFPCSVLLVWVVGTPLYVVRVRVSCKFYNFKSSWPWLANRMGYLPPFVLNHMWPKWSCRTIIYVDFITCDSMYTQGRINHCDCCTMGVPPPPAPSPDQLSNFHHAVLTFERLNVQCKLKRNDDD